MNNTTRSLPKLGPNTNSLQRRSGLGSISITAADPPPPLHSCRRSSSINMQVTSHGDATCTNDSGDDRAIVVSSSHHLANGVSNLPPRPTTCSRHGDETKGSRRAPSASPNANSPQVSVIIDRLYRPSSRSSTTFGKSAALIPRKSVSSSSSSAGGPSSSSSYWAVASRAIQSRDLGHTCKECGKPFTIVGAPMLLRRGGRIELKYHEWCFSGTADPRTQPNSSYVTSGYDLPTEAPQGKYLKMRTSAHF